MAKVDLRKNVTSISNFDKTVDRTFSTYVQQVEIPEVTVNEFFATYERIFFDIPSQGEENSHEYLARRSSQVSNFEKDTSDIQPLLDEISNLREQLIEANLTILELQIGSNGS